MTIQDSERNLRRGVPAALAPLSEQALLARAEVRRMRQRARKLASPAYVNTDAAFRDDRAGVAYASRALGDRIAVVSAKDSTEGEFWALVMAMYDADSCLSCWPAIVFRTDCTSVAHFAVVKKRHLQRVRAEVVEMLDAHRQWSVQLIRRSWNAQANRLSREALDEMGMGADERREVLLGRHA
jgi:thioesterase domain-containing protein